MEQLEARRLLNGTGLTGTYYDNRDFSGATFVRVDPTIDFDWHSGSPAPGIAPYTYSVRWVGQVQPRYSETYTFHTTGNDAVRLWVNGRHLVDDWNDGPAERHSGRITLRAGEKYSIRMDYYQNLGTAMAKLEWSSPSQPLEIVPSTRLYPDVTPTGTGEGLEVTYFNRPDFTGTTVKRVEGTIDFNHVDEAPAPGVRSVTYSARWMGQVQPRYSETYTFHTTADRGMRLWVDDQLLVDDFVRDAQTRMGTATASEALGIASGETGIWAGRTVYGTDSVVMYTYSGDANLDGQINVDDYGQIDFAAPLQIPGWSNGDFNYDGKIDIDDYGEIDFNVGIQGPPLTSGSGAAAWPAEELPRYNSRQITLQAGQKYDIRVEYFHDTGEATAKLEWSSASQPREVVPASQLYPPDVAPPLPGEWGLIFRDEFSGTALNPVWHTAQYWDHDHTIVGHGELQAYSPTAATVADGLLTLTARPDSRYGVPYVSALVQTGGDTWVSGEPKFSFTYGYVEVRAKVPPGQGLWPAIWMMPASHNDSAGEIDIVEFVGSEVDMANFAIRRFGEYKGAEWRGPDFTRSFHTYGVDWQPTHVAWYVDGVERARVTNRALIPDEAMYPILNVAVGGEWPGSPDATTPFPASMEVDYVRVWQRPTAMAPFSDASAGAAGPITTAASAPSDARPVASTFGSSAIVHDAADEDDLATRLVASDGSPIV